VENKKKYCNSLTAYSRWETREVQIGDVPMGAGNPIRIQSMTTTHTLDTVATVEQSIRMIEAGSEYVRITAPGKREAENLLNIKNELRKAGYKTPLVADIHYTPNAAEIAARIVEKVRINPGNYADKKKFEHIEYTDETYQLELERIRKRFTPLIKICKEYGTAMRIGTNHGSLSDRIMSRFGDTPLGMVESAMEFLKMCEDESYYNIVLSMKSSNPLVMVQAYRLLVNRMMQEGMNYPLHLGVTEAGEGEDGRIKSAMGIGALLEDGLGDTIRVSLTEEPEHEIPVARELVARYVKRNRHETIKPISQVPVDPYQYQKRKTRPVVNIGGGQVPVVMADFSMKDEISRDDLKDVGYAYHARDDKWYIKDIAADYIFTNDKTVGFNSPQSLRWVYNYKTWLQNFENQQVYPFLMPNEYMNVIELHPELNFVYATLPDLNVPFLRKLKEDTTAVLLIDTYNTHGMAEQRRLFFELMENDLSIPVIIGRAYDGLTEEQLQLYASTDIGGLMIDGLGDGVFIDGGKAISQRMLNQLGFGILQAARTRISKTEYISCPSCGRTLFDLQQTTAKIRAQTAHLKGLKIGVMGCIVNGPGEMADADFGYVGTGPGKVSLYKGREMVKRNIPEENALEELIALIKENGKWVDSR
jgi:(E)-4-hydroxy-3-methylbut-2-enyl-diphosphate synthase